MTQFLSSKVTVPKHVDIAKTAVRETQSRLASHHPVLAPAKCRLSLMSGSQCYSVTWMSIVEPPYFVEICSSSCLGPHIYAFFHISQGREYCHLIETVVFDFGSIKLLACLKISTMVIRYCFDTCKRLQKRKKLDLIALRSIVRPRDQLNFPSS